MRSILGFLGSKTIHSIIMYVMLIVPIPFIIFTPNATIENPHHYLAGTITFGLFLVYVVRYCYHRINDFFAPKNPIDENDVSFFQILLGITNISVCFIVLVALCIPGRNLPKPDVIEAKIVEYIQLLGNFLYA